MPVNWKSAENNERLLACLFASIDEAKVKLNWNRIAELFGQGTTGNAIECNFRKIRAASKGIKQEWEARNAGGATPTPTAVAAAPRTPKTPSTPKTPKKNSMSAVKDGRIEKTTPKKTKVAVKMEEMPTPPSDVPFTPISEIVTSFDSIYGHHGLNYTGDYGDEV